MCSERSGMFSWFHRYLDLSDPTQFGWDMGLCMQLNSVHGTTLCACSELCAQLGLEGSPYSKDTLISLIWPNFAEIWSHACKHISCMNASLHAWVVLYIQTGKTYSPNSINALIFLIWPNLAEIWACARRHIACIDASLWALDELLLRQVRHLLLIPKILLSLWYDPIWLRYGPVHASI